MRKIILIITALIISHTMFANIVTIGYTNGNFNRREGIRFSTTNKQGMAIKISQEKAAALKGSKIISVKSVFGTSQVKDLEIFVTKNLDGTPIATAKGTEAGTRFKTYKFDTPIEIDGEEFYVGYTFNLEDGYKALLFDRTKDFEGELFFALEGNKWENITNKGLGAANIQFEIENATQFTDVIIKPINVSGYYKEGNTYEYSTQILNFGTNEINSIEIEQKIGNKETSIYKKEGLALKQGETFDVSLPQFKATETGKLKMNVSIITINGEDKDTDQIDNKCETMTFVYPSNVQKKILVEGFTGQGCGNCPTGHSILAKALKGQEENFIEVSHHAGYFPDSFTMKEDVEYTFFYGGGSYAPAVMFNRTPFEEGLKSPVFEMANTANIEKSINYLSSVQPYVSIEMNAKYYKGNEVLGVEVKVTTHVIPSDRQHTLNVFLTQNNLAGSQSGGGDNYVHNHVFRGSMTDVWGMPINLNEGETLTYYYGIHLDESIKSSHENKQSHKVVLEDMKIVAFVGDIANSHMECPVFNCNSTDIKVVDGNGELDVENTEEYSQHKLVSKNGRIVILGDYNEAEIYNANGILVERKYEDTNSKEFTPGIYIVRIQNSNGTYEIQKIFVK